MRKALARLLLKNPTGLGLATGTKNCFSLIFGACLGGGKIFFLK